MGIRERSSGRALVTPVTLWMAGRARRFALLLVVPAALGIAVLAWMAAPLPPALARPGPVSRLVLLDRHGVPLRVTRTAQGRRGGWTPLDELDPKILQAFLAVEDQRFFAHHGVDLRALARALAVDLRAGHVVSGGSTISMQLDRLLRGTTRTIPGKLSQILWTLRLETHLDKQAILEQYLGVASLLATLHAAGFVSLDQSAEYYGLGLALGNGDVTLLEPANAYRALATGGVWRPVRWREGGPPAGGAAERREMSPPAAALVLDILSDPVAWLPGFGLETPLDFPFRTAAKTGTTRHFTDNWAVATTEAFTAAVWVGNFNGRPMQGVGGITGAGPLLHRAVLLVGRRYPPGDLPTPAGVGAIPIRICRLSGFARAPLSAHDRVVPSRNGAGGQL